MQTSDVGSMCQRGNHLRPSTVGAGISYLNVDSTSKTKHTTIDELLDGACPHVQFRCLSVLALSNACDALETLSIGFLLPLLTKSTAFEKECLAAALFVGMLSGGFASGGLSARHGRARLLTASLALEGVATLAGAASPSVLPYFVISRFFTGCGVGATVPSIFALAPELFSRDRRERYISIICASFIIGSIMVSSIAWLALEALRSSWQFYYALTAILPFFNSAACLLLPESPVYLLQQADTAGLQRTFRTLLPNRTDKEIGELIAGLSADPMLTPLADEEKEVSVQSVQGSYTRLKVSVVSFGIAYVWYGLSTWLIAIFTDMGVTNPYAAAILYAIFGFLGALPAVYLVDVFGPKTLLVWGVAASVLCSMAAALGVHGTAGVLVASLLNSTTNGVFSALMVYSSTAPLENRSMALATFAAAMRFGSILAQFADGEFAARGQLWGVHTTNAAVLVAVGLLAMTLVPTGKDASRHCVATHD